MTYIIDFERINQLTSSPNDNPSSGGGYNGPSFCYQISRKILKEYMEIYTDRISRRATTDEQFASIVETLRYNGILLTEADIRDRKLDKLLPETKTDGSMLKS